MVEVFSFFRSFVIFVVIMFWVELARALLLFKALKQDEEENEVPSFSPSF